MRLIKFLLLITFVVVGSVITFQLTIRSGGTEIIGDHAPDVTAALGEVPEADGPPTLAALLVENWGRLIYVDGAIEACGAPCRPGINLVRVLSIDPREARKTIYLELKGPLAEPTCAAEVIEAEATGLTAPAQPAICAPDLVSETVWLLPFGWGRL